MHFASSCCFLSPFYYAHVSLWKCLVLSNVLRNSSASTASIAPSFMNISRRASVTSAGIRCEFLQLKNQEQIIKILVNGNTTNRKQTQGYCTLYQESISFLAKDNFSVRPMEKESKTALDSGFHTVNSGFHVLDSSLCQWNLDSAFNR